MDRLVVDGWGKLLSMENNQVVVKERKGKSYSVIHRCLPSNLRQVVITGKGSITTSAIEILADNGVDVILIDWKGNVKARITPPIMRTVNTRREQYRAYDEPKGAQLVKEIVYAKLRNQMAVLGTLAKTRKDTQPQIAGKMMKARSIISRWSEEVNKIEGSSCDEVRNQLLGMEGNASAAYWDAISTMVGNEFRFSGRSGRYATDPLNAMLNYGYAVLEGESWRAIHYAGLDPYGGFLHVDRPGRASMVLDLMEEFRQQLVDKTVFRLFTQKQVKPEQFSIENGICVMADKPRKLLLSELLSKLEDRVRYGDANIRWTDLILKKARDIAKFLRGESKLYKGFWLRW